MNTLILCVDRDDDLGRKAKMQSPLVGRAQVLEAANALALADPEDTDANSLFGAVATYDKLMRERDPLADHAYEVAAIAGHIDVGTRSDELLVTQFEDVLGRVGADNMILVSDGAEDEYILPILESRIRINSVKRVVIKQAPRLEGFYYLMVRIFEDEKLQKRFFLPISIALIVWGLAYSFGRPQLAWGMTLLVLGGLLLIRVLHWEEKLARFGRDLAKGLKDGKISFFTTLASVFLIGYGCVLAYLDLRTSGAAAGDRVLYTFSFLRTALWWIVAGLILNVVGRAIDDLVRTRTTQGRYWRYSFSILSMGFILSATVDLLLAIRIGTPLADIVRSVPIYTQLAAGVLIAIIGSLTYRYVSQSMREEDEVDEVGARGAGQD